MLPPCLSGSRAQGHTAPRGQYHAGTGRFHSRESTGSTLSAGRIRRGDHNMGFPSIGRVIRDDPAIDSLIPPGATIERLASGTKWAEGPVWVSNGEFLLYSDIPNNRILKWSAAEGQTVFMQPSGFTGVVDYSPEPGSNGLTLDSQGRLVLCEHGDRRISRLEHEGGKRTLADNYLGRRLNSPNDLVYRSNGDLYFTDPPYGLPHRENDPRRELDFFGVFRLSPDGVLTLQTKQMERPNGLAFSPDERFLYVTQSDPDEAIVMRFPMLRSGNIDEDAGIVFWDATPLARSLPGLPDGMKVDVHCNLFVTGPGGVHVLDSEGTHLGRIETGERTANCAWGDDGSTLYICADQYLCRIILSTSGTMP